MSLRLAFAAVLLCGAQNVASAAEPAAEQDRPAPAPRGPLPYVRLLGSAALGTGLRFNNPYRLATPLGDDARSLSRTATYVDFGGTFLFGAPTLLQHGPGLRVSVAIEGVAQQVMAPSYVVCKEWRSVQPCVRAAIPLVLRPDSNVGVELGLSATYWVRSGIGATLEGVFDLFYGASTRETKYPAYPVLSLQAGIMISYEVLP